MSDPAPRLHLWNAMLGQSESYAAEVAVFDAACLKVAQECVDLWHRLWFGLPVAVDSAAQVKFRVCFPLAAHALNHVEIALGLQHERPWVAASSTRIAFEHALAAQWTLLTEDGEQELVNWMKGELHRQAKEFADALSRLDSGPDAPPWMPDESQRQALVGEPPDVSDWSVFNVCSRFADTKLFYDIYRELSQAVHPSLALIAAHLTVGTAAAPTLNPAGTLRPCNEVPRALALSALWSLYVLEQLRDGQPHATQIVRIGEDAALSVDLRPSDQHPERQPRVERQPEV